MSGHGAMAFLQTVTACLAALMLNAHATVWAAEAPVKTARFHWTPIGYGGGGRFTTVTTAPTNGNTIYAGSDVAGIFRSDDGGNRFQPVGAEFDGLSVADILVSRNRAQDVLALTTSGVYWSSDSGMHWQLVSRNVRYLSRYFGNHLLLQTAEGEFLAATDADGIYKLTHSADKWNVRPLNGLEDVKVNSLGLAEGKIFAATEHGIYRWDETRWTGLNDGLPAKKRSMQGLATASRDGNLFAVERETGVFQFNGKSQSWQFIGPREPAITIASGQKTQYKALAVSPADPNILLLGTYPTHWPYMVLRSTDRGRSWNRVGKFPVSDGLDNWAKDLQAVEDIDFSSDGRRIILSDWWNVWRSDDVGNTWTQLHRGLQNTVVNKILVPDTDGQRIYAAVADNGLMISQDGGMSWQRRMHGVPDGNAKDIACSTRNRQRCYLLMEPWNSDDKDSLARLHFYRSDDGARTWRHYAIRHAKRTWDKPYVSGLPTGLRIDPIDDNVVYVATNGYGIFRADTATAKADGTVAENNISEDIPTPYLQAPDALLIHPSRPGIMYAATLEGGVFKTTNGGKSWQALPEARGFTFGMAMDPAKPERLAVAAGDNILRSDDGGNTWRSTRLPGINSTDVAAVSVAFASPGSRTVFVGTLGFDYKSARGVFVSEDDGAHLRPLHLDMPHVGVNHLAPVPRRGGILLGTNGLGIIEVRAEGK